MKEIFIQTENVRKFWSTLENLTDTKNGQPGIALIYGESGAGMTMCAQNYASETGAVLLRATQEWTPRGMLNALCSAIDGSQPSSLEKCRNALTDALKQTPRAILIDEADRLKGLKMIELLIEIHDTTGAPLILMSDHTLHNKISSHTRIQNRITQTVELKPIAIENTVSFFDQATDLKIDLPVAQTIYNQIGGNFWRISQIVRKLEQMAAASGTDTVTVEMAQQLVKGDITLSRPLSIAS